MKTIKKQFKTLYEAMKYCERLQTKYSNVTMKSKGNEYIFTIKC